MPVGGELTYELTTVHASSGPGELPDHLTIIMRPPLLSLLLLLLLLLAAAVPGARASAKSPASQKQRTRNYLALLEKTDWVNFVEGRVQGWPGSLSGQPPLVGPPVTDQSPTS